MADPPRDRGRGQGHSTRQDDQQTDLHDNRDLGTAVRDTGHVHAGPQGWPESGPSTTGHPTITESKTFTARLQGSHNQRTAKNHVNNIKIYFSTVATSRVNPPTDL